MEEDVIVTQEEHQFNGNVRENIVSSTSSSSRHHLFTSHCQSLNQCQTKFLCLIISTPLDLDFQYIVEC